MHKRLTQQLSKANVDAPGGIDRLLTLIDEAYTEHDLERKRSERSTALMAEELEELYEKLQNSARTIELQNVRSQAAQDNMPQSLSLFDSEGQLAVYNRRFVEMFQLGRDYDPIGKTLSEILVHSGVHGSAMDVGRRVLTLEHVAMDSLASSKLEQVWPDGRIISIARSAIPDGGYLDTISDVTESRKAMAQIAHMASYDALTDLPNRSLYCERLLDAAHHAQRGEHCAIMYLDLDRFKVANDTYGHPVGDALLIAASSRLRANVRDIDTVARFGGDEFALILRQLKTSDETCGFAQRIIDELSMPFVLEGHSISIGASIGIAVMTPMHNDPDELMRDADVALYKAKADGRGTFRLFQPDLQTLVDERHQLEADLRTALTLGEFEVHYQPQFDSRTKTITGFEALLRWISPLRGVVYPDDFTHVTEKIGLTEKLEAWILETACFDAKNWPSTISVAVNISACHFRGGKILALVLGALEKVGLSPKRLELEISESVLLNDSANVLSLLRQLKQLGVKISLDHFGQGRSALSYIRDFAFDKIKIDQSFIQDLDSADDGLAIVRGVAAMCDSMGIASTAAGVETQAQFDLLNTEHWNLVQGNLFAKPMTATAALSLLK